MATIKSYSDPQQSKKLSEILPLESADAFYMVGEKPVDIVPIYGFVTHQHLREQMAYKRAIPCWSLAALLDIFAKQDFIIKSSERNNEYQYNIDIPIRHCKIWFSSLLDAAFEMVCWLKENNKL